jgi:RNA polymerase sigma factor (TIGR02999 family)
VDLLALLDSSRAGDAEASKQSQAAVYEALRTLARRQLKRSGGNTLNTTALVHEAWLKVANNARRDFESRAHFFAIAAKAMRQILVDHARRRHAHKRGGGRAFATSALSSVGVDSNVEGLLAVDAILAKLEALDPRLARIVEWRFFGGLEEEEIARALDIHVRTVQRDWRKGRAFILAELDEA